MKKVAITGNIAAGKSAVENIIKNLGYKVIDADDICHRAFIENEVIISKIKKFFNNIDIVDEYGFLDRKKIGEIVFKNDNDRFGIEKIIHPFVKSEIQSFIAKNKSESLIFVSVPLLFETGMDKMFDKIILICADEDIRLKRLMIRNNLTEEEAKIRMKSQITQDDKITLSNYLIDNNSDFIHLQQQVMQVTEQLLL